MKPAMIMHLTMVVVAGASFGRSRFRSEPFLRRFLDNTYNWVFANRSRCRINDIRYLIGLSGFVVLTTVRYHIGLSVLFTVRYRLGLSWYFYLQFNVHTYVEVRSLAGLSPPPRIQYVLY